MITHKIRTCMPQGKPRQGFTLVELLVSISIIIVLAALSFGITGKIRARAQQANAVSALRQVGIGHVAYAAENNTSINYLRDTGENLQEGGGNAWVSNTFWGRMQPYLFAGIENKDQKILQRDIKSAINVLFNTTDAKTMAGTPFSGISSWGDLSGISVPLAFNAKLRPAWNQPQIRMSTVSDPSRIFYCSYGRYFVDQTHTSAYAPLPLAGDKGRCVYFPASRQAIICFVDGHVETVSPPILERTFQ